MYKETDSGGSVTVGIYSIQGAILPLQQNYKHTQYTNNIPHHI